MGWTIATVTAPRLQTQPAIVFITRQPDQCDDGRAEAMKDPMSAVSVLKELRNALSEQKPDAPSVKARLAELGTTKIAPAARSVIESLTRNSLNLG